MDNPFLGKLFDRCAVLFVDVDDVDVVLVENLIVVLLETGSFDAERMWWSKLRSALPQHNSHLDSLFREQQLLLLRILHPGHLLLSPEVVRDSIGVLTEKVVLVST